MNNFKNLLNNTIPKEEVGRFRLPEEHVVILRNEHEIAFEPPLVSFVEESVKALCDFANNIPEGQFVHPVIKAILLHFWIIYLHPFKAGSVRVARMVFYWYLMKNG